VIIMDWLILTASIVVLTAGVIVAAPHYFKRGTASEALIESGLRDLKEVLDRLDRNLRDEMARNRSELSDALGRSNTTMSASVGSLTQMQKTEFEGFAARLTNQADANERRLEALRTTVDDRLRLLSEENSRKLEQMRQTVDEKLQGTLEQRLGESFKQVSDRLEMVHRGLGEMQTLAAGVGDLKKVLSNVKTRGTRLGCAS